MPLSWNEIKERATAFSKEWENEASEDGEAKSFWDGFFNVFGVSRRRVASFEKRVTKQDGRAGFVDLLWKGTLLIEHKSRGRDLDRAFTQAKEYFPGLKEYELPRYILVSDFERFRLYNLDNNDRLDFSLQDLVDNVQHFDFLAGYEKRTYQEQDPVNITAAELMGRLHDQLKESGFSGHDLELYLVRLLFCLFADDTTIFEKGIFQDLIEQRTNEQCGNLGLYIEQLFQVLNTPTELRYKTLDEQLVPFPFVNGKLFEERLPIASFSPKMRETLLECCSLDWGAISPAIFGSLFQSVMDKEARRNLGAHYTSEQNILKVINPLFLEGLWAEFESIKGNRNKLISFHNKLGSLKFLDPACGCGNFLIIAYRELRLLEMEVVKYSMGSNELTFNLEDHLKVNVDQFYGIEYDEFPAQIAQTAMWLMDHQMNMVASRLFGKYYLRLPLTKSAIIHHGNALRTPWKSLLADGEKYDYIMGNPPFIGSKMMKADQRKDLEAAMANIKNAGILDYVAAWYSLGASYIHESRDTEMALVSTNSITQGEQVSVLWPRILVSLGLEIQFAHRTFKWANEAKGNAAVHCIIIGLSKPKSNAKRLFHYSSEQGAPQETIATNINGYLANARNVFLLSRNEPICAAPKIGIGNKPIDGGHYLFTENEKIEFLTKEPKAAPYFKKWIGADEFINGYTRWCLWLGDASPSELRSMPLVMDRIKAVKQFREESKSIPTQKLASTPTRFHVENMPTDSFMVLPEVTTPRRLLIPVGYINSDILASNLLKVIPSSEKYVFGILSSKMHTIWTRHVCGRLGNSIRYSVQIVYNNYPWPEVITPKQKAAVEKAAQGILDVRAQYPTSSLADLYDPLSMPPDLLKAHQALDKAVDACYRSQPFQDDEKRIEFLFDLYEKYTAGMFVPEKKKRTTRKPKA